MALTTPDDLVRRATQGDRAALHDLLLSLDPYLRAVLASYLGPATQPADLDDAVQATQARVLGIELRLDRHTLADFRAWVTTVAWHCASEARRQLRRREYTGMAGPREDQPNLLDGQADPGDTPSRQARWQEWCHRLRAAVEALPEPDRTIVILRHFECLPVGEVAARLDLNAGAVRMRCMRALHQLRDELGGSSQAPLSDR